MIRLPDVQVHLSLVPVIKYFSHIVALTNNDDLVFYIPFNIIKSYRDDGRMIMKVCNKVQYSHELSSASSKIRTQGHMTWSLEGYSLNHPDISVAVTKL